jgi:Predicted phosphohydrolases
MKIIHLSDIHVASPHFLPNVLEDVINDINEISPDLVVITGDLTDFGYIFEYEEAKRYVDEIECERKVIVPGNHDARNSGYLLFEEFFGERLKTLNYKNITVVGVDSSEPDIDDGHIGREKYEYIEESFNGENFKIFALHHHLLPVPMCGRERNVPVDAGDVLELLDRLKVDLVLCGHRHVPWVWRLNNMIVLNAGTACTNRTKGRIGRSYNLIELDEGMKIYRISPTGERNMVIDEKF